MNFEIITIHEHYGNFAEGSREAKLFADGSIEYVPEPDYPDEDLVDTYDQEEEEDDV